MRTYDDASTGTRPRTVGVLEVDPTGHRLQYVHHLVEAVGADRSVVFVPASAHAEEEWATHLAHLGADTVAVPGEDDRAGSLTEAVDRSLERGVTRLVITEGDDYLVPLLRLLLRRPRLRLELRLLLMRTQAVRGPERVTAAVLGKPVVAHLVRLFPQVRLHFLTDAFGEVTSRPGYRGIRGVRDPVAPPPARPEPAPPTWFPHRGAGTILVGLFGVITPRKNLPLLLRAAREEPAAVVVVGGRLSPEVATRLEADPDAAALRAEGRLVVVDRMLDPTEFAAALGTVDVVAVLHDNDSPSGVLAESCVHGTPVVVPAGAWLARVVGATGIGRATTLTAPAVAAALREVHRDHDAHVAAALRARSRVGTGDFTTTLLGGP